MKEQVDKSNVRIEIPHAIAMNITTLLGQGSLRLTMEGAPRYKDVTDIDNPTMVVGIESIEEIFITELLKNYGTTGYNLSWNSVVNSPYIELPKDAVIPDELAVYEGAVWENDTHKLIRIYGKVETNTYPCTFDVLKNWVDTFDIANIISTPKLVAAKMLDYNQEI